MISKKTRTRILYSGILLIFFILVLFLILRSLEDNVVYFFSPSEISSKESISVKEKIRIGGIVKEGSIKKVENSTNFIITDFVNEIMVSFDGALPNLFAETKGVVAEGKLYDKKYFIAETILAKHDENYMPPEVSDALKKAKE